MTATVRFVTASSSAPQLEFDGRAWTRSRPALMMPIGVGLTAARAVGLIPVVANGTMGLHEEFGGTVKRLDKAIVEQLKRNYYQAGWAWPRKTAGRADAGRSS